MDPTTLGNKQKKDRRLVRSRRGVICWGLGTIVMTENAPGNGVSVGGSTTVKANEKRRNRKERNTEGG